MPTKRQLDGLAAEYRRAKQFVAKAQLIIAETQQVANSVTGLYGPTSALGLFEAMEQLRYSLNQARDAIAAATPDPPQ